MAIAKDIPEVYLCETETDREKINCRAGQKCIMANGDIYMCISAGIWRKLGVNLCAAKFMVEDEVYENQAYAEGESIFAPVDPVVSGGTFNGWKVADSLVTFPYTLSVDTVFVADISVTPPTPPTFSFEIKASEAVIADPSSGNYAGIGTPALDLTDMDRYTSQLVIGGAPVDITFDVKYDSSFTGYDTYILTWESAGSSTISIIDKTILNPEAFEFTYDENSYTWIVTGAEGDFDFIVTKSALPSYLFVDSDLAIISTGDAQTGNNRASLDLVESDIYQTDINWNGTIYPDILFTTGYASIGDFSTWQLAFQGTVGTQEIEIRILDKVRFDTDARNYVQDENSMTWIVNNMDGRYYFALNKQ